MNRWAAARFAVLSVVLLGLTGCDVFFGDGGDGTNTFAPRITDALPGDGTQTVPTDGGLLFTASGDDADSLDLEWTWELDQEVHQAGSASDGDFESSWLLSWDSSRSGSSGTVAFTVDDGTFDATVTWPVLFE